MYESTVTLSNLPKSTVTFSNHHQFSPWMPTTDHNQIPFCNAFSQLRLSHYKLHGSGPPSLIFDSFSSQINSFSPRKAIVLCHVFKHVTESNPKPAESSSIHALLLKHTFRYTRHRSSPSMGFQQFCMYVSPPHKGKLSISMAWWYMREQRHSSTHFEHRR